MRLCLITLGLCSAAGGYAQSPAVVTSADYGRAESFMPHRTAQLVRHVAEAPTWLSNGRLWYRRSAADGGDVVLVQVANGSTRPVSEADQVALGISAAQAGPDEALSPDRRRAAFIRDHNLWVRELADGSSRPLTTDGILDFGYATDNAGWKHSARAIVSWSPDSKRIATYQQDQRGVAEMYLVKTRVGHPELESWKYAMPGDAVVPTIQRVIIDVDSGRIVRLRMPADQRRTAHCYDLDCGPGGSLTDVEWRPDGAALAFVSMSRDHKIATLRVADADTGTVRDVLEESVATYYESATAWMQRAVNWRYLWASHEAVWFSQRDDWGHLYLYDARTGKLEHRITAGAWNVVDLLGIDEKRRIAYLIGVGREPQRDPYYRHLYKIGLDGKGLTLLTPENADHDVSLEPSLEHFVDSYSTPQAPPTSVLRDRNGRKIRVLETADLSPLTELGWKPPVPITVKARDAVTELHGLMFKPTRFREDLRYPLIDVVYPGPMIGSVGSRAFAPSRGDAQSLAELGFIVVEIDGMGTSLRSKAFQDLSYGRIEDNTLPDQVAGIRELAQRFPWIDLSRIGIAGHSGGGYAAAAAMFRYPDLFKVGVSESGNHDQRGYEGDWGEQYLGLLERGADRTAYDRQDDYAGVANLKGHLLIMHGTGDDNVPLNLTLLLVDALIHADKDFDLLLLPGDQHLYTGEHELYAARRRWDYFVRHLLGAEPPAGYRLQETVH